MKNIHVAALALLASILLPLCAIAAANPTKSGPAIVYQTNKSFDSAKQDLLLAIEGRGLVVSYTSHAQEMLDRTADASGTKKPVYEKAEIVLFCKSDLSHALVAANPHNIVACPYAIAIYSLKGKPETTYLSFREPFAGDKSFAPINQLLDEIVREVAQN